MHETREIFRLFPQALQIAFYLVGFATIFYFLFGSYKIVRKYRKGRPAGRWNKLGARFMKALGTMAKHSTLSKRNRYVGVAHWLIFWGFVVLFIGTVIVALDHDFLRFMGIHLLQGKFYLWFSLFLDVFGVAFLVGLLMMAFRRAKKPPELDYTRPDLPEGKYDRKPYVTDDKIFLWLLFFIGLTGFFIEGLRILGDNYPPFEVWSPVGWFFAHAFDGLGLSAKANTIFIYTWWFHAVMVLGFIAYLPHSKAMHILVDFANLMFKDELAAKRLPKVTEEKMKEGMGYVKLTDFTWKELMDFDACTKCGRCHVACPARASGAPLSPRDLILEMRTFAEQKAGTPEWFMQQESNGWTNKKEPAIAGDVIKADTLWACTTCMACVEACPVGIEHLTTIVNLRRTLVDEGNMEDSLQDVLMNIGDYGNSFGQSDRMRAKWTKELDFKIKDARKEEVDYLWYVGDYASYDQRIQSISRKVAKILNDAGVSFGILYEAEKNSGNDVRRIGEEGLYEMLVEDNMAALEEASFKEIFTTDPHTLNTLKNEYPEFGGHYKVKHYTQLLIELIKSGKLQLKKKLNYTVTYHDPCYLGRYNGITEEPRELLRLLGVELKEMPRNRSNSFCCGAGGGRIWMDDSKLEKRPSEMRIEEALALGEVDCFIVSCPKDYAMYSDAVKTSGHEGKLEVKDVIDLLEEALS